MSQRPVDLQRRVDGKFVRGVLHDALQPQDLLLIEKSWGPLRVELLGALLAQNVPRNHWPESLHWDWGEKAPALSRLAATAVGILLEEKWQGVMLTKTVPYVAQLSPDRGKPLVYVDFLEAAPWNWNIEALARRGEYRSVGSILFREAVLLSRKEGFSGRVGLHALPRAEGFYQRLRMVELGRDSAKQDLRYFELDAACALRFLNDGGEL